MAMVRKCDRCDSIEGVTRFTIRWEGGSGTADLCEEHGAELMSFVTVEQTIRRGAAGRRRGPSLKATSLEEIEAQKAKKSTSRRK